MQHNYQKENVSQSLQDFPRSINDLQLIHAYKKVSTKISEEQLYKHEGISLSTIAKKTKIARYKVSAAINTIGNKNFREYINAYRVKEARELLVNSGYKHYTIDAIANEVGFTNRVSFINAFKKRYRQTPHAYRLSHEVTYCL